MRHERVTRLSRLIFSARRCRDAPHRYDIMAEMNSNGWDRQAVEAIQIYAIQLE